MKFRFGDKSGAEVPPLEQSLQDLQTSLAQKQKQWAEQVASDPACFAQLEPQIHQAFQEFADRCAASLLAEHLVERGLAAADAVEEPAPGPPAPVGPTVVRHGPHRTGD